MPALYESATGNGCGTGGGAGHPHDGNAEAGASVHWGTFETIGDAEAFLCVELPYPRETTGWKLDSVSAGRTHPLNHFEEGEYTSPEFGYKQALFVYVHASGSATPLELHVYPKPWLADRDGVGCEGLATDNRLIIRLASADEGSVYRGFGIEGDPYMAACWEQDSLSFVASFEWRGQIDLQQDFLRLIESIE
jgi:hypothetical protein